MESATVDDLLFAAILAGLLLSVAGLIVSIFNGRTSQRAQIKAISNLRELYERAYKKTPLKSRRFASIARPGKVERRSEPSRGAGRADA